MFEYLQFVQKYAYEKNDIDKKRLFDYYIENDASVVPIEYWHKTDIETIKTKEWDIKDLSNHKSS